MSRQSRTPLFTGRKEDAEDFLAALNDSLYTQPQRFIPDSNGLTGTKSGILVATGRHLDVSIEITGPTVSSGGTMNLPVRPMIKMPLRAVTWVNPSVFLGDCLLDSNGVLTLPDWNTSDSVVISGSVVEG